MLKNLKIKNFALISSAEINFGKGLNIIIGETGAGKSVIVDALMMLLGEKASPDFVRSGESKAVIEAIFTFPIRHPIFDLLDSNGYDCENEEIIIRREILAKGSSRSFVNDTPAQFSFLKEAGALLVDFHGQHEHQLLLKKENHIDVLDIIADSDRELEEYKNVFLQLKSQQTKFREMSSQKEYYLQKAERQRFDLKEINTIDPLPGEDALLENELSLRENSEELFQLSEKVYNLLYHSDFSVNDKLTESKITLEQLSNIDEKFRIYLDEINSASIAVREVAKFTLDYKDNIDFDPKRLEEIRERASKIRGLIKKYGSFDNIFIKKQELVQEISLVDGYDDEILQTKQEIEALRNNLGLIANKLSSKRQKAGKTMSVFVVDALKNLGIESSQFKVLISQQIAEKVTFDKTIAYVNGSSYEANPLGIDNIEFYISTNVGEKTKPLVETASGGEISRVMLAIKQLVANSDRLPLLVFDEIDNGISGRIARKAGIAMKQLSENHQIIAITHLPQIAALSDTMIAVRKKVSQEQTFIEAIVLNGEERITETARLISGEEISDTALQTAKELSILE